MKLLIPIIAILSFLLSTSSFTQSVVPQTTATDIVVKSIVRVTVTTPTTLHTCTGFSVGPRKFLTAAHCTEAMHTYLGAVLRVNNLKAFILKEDPITDLATIVVDLDLPPLAIRDIPLQRGESVHAIGFGAALQYPIVTYQVVQLLDYRLSDEIYPGTIFLYPLIGGMSGGPIYDDNAEVVGVAQRTAESTISYGVTAATINKFLAN